MPASVNPIHTGRWVTYTYAYLCIPVRSSVNPTHTGERYVTEELSDIEEVHHDVEEAPGDVKEP